jgi:hypothetical protein
MTTESINEQYDIAEALAFAMNDDGDIAVERFLSPTQTLSNPFFVNDQPMDTAASSWMAAVTFDASQFHDQNFELTEHHDEANHFATEDITLTDVDLSGMQV